MTNITSLKRKKRTIVREIKRLQEAIRTKTIKNFSNATREIRYLKEARGALSKEIKERQKQKVKA